MCEAHKTEPHPPGFYWHVHHGVLLEYCWDYGGRARFIRGYKDQSEIPIRLRLFKPVKGTLPQAVIKAGQMVGNTERMYDKTRRAYLQAEQVHDEAEQVHDEAWQAYYKALQAYYKALYDNLPAIEALHRQEHPRCPWDGETIFPKTA